MKQFAKRSGRLQQTYWEFDIIEKSSIKCFPSVFFFLFPDLGALSSKAKNGNGDLQPLGDSATLLTISTQLTKWPKIIALFLKITKFQQFSCTRHTLLLFSKAVALYIFSSEVCNIISKISLLKLYCHSFAYNFDPVTPHCINCCKNKKYMKSEYSCMLLLLRSLKRNLCTGTPQCTTTIEPRIYVANLCC